MCTAETDDGQRNGAGLHVYAVWALALAVLVVVGIAGNAVLARQVDQWRADDPPFHWKEAERLLAGGNYVGAQLALQEALRLGPDRPEGHRILGNLHYELKAWDKALAAYQTALAKGGTAPALYGRALWCLMHLGRYAEAAELGRKSIEAGAAPRDMQRYVGEAYLRAQRPTEAVPYLEAALKEAPTNTGLMERLVTAYRSLGQQAKADAMLERISEANTALESAFSSGDEQSKDPA